MHVFDCVYVCGNFETKFFEGGENVKPGKNVFFSKRSESVIIVGTIHAKP